MRVVNTGASSYAQKYPENFLIIIEKDRNNFPEAFLGNIIPLSPFVWSVDNLIGYETNATLKCLANFLLSKILQP